MAGRVAVARPAARARELSLLRTLGWVVSLLVLLLVVLIALAPFVWLLLGSFKTKLDIIDPNPNLNIWNWRTIQENYRQVLVGRNFLTFIRNSVIVVGFSTAIALLFGVPAAYGFSRFRFRGKQDLAFWILSNRFMPVMAVVIPIQMMVSAAGLLDTHQGLIIPYAAFNIPLVIWILRGFFDEISPEIDEAALIDGCSRWQALWRVVLPLSLPGLVTTAIFCAIFTWNEFLMGLFIVTTARSQTVPVGASGLLSMDRSVEWNIMSTVGVVTIIPVLIFALLVQRHIVRGLTAGAVK